MDLWGLNMKGFNGSTPGGAGLHEQLGRWVQWPQGQFQEQMVAINLPPPHSHTTTLSVEFAKAGLGLKRNLK